MDYLNQLAMLLSCLLSNINRLKVTGAGILLLSCSFVFSLESWSIILLSFFCGAMSACEIIDLLSDIILEDE